VFLRNVGNYRLNDVTLLTNPEDGGRKSTRNTIPYPSVILSLRPYIVSILTASLNNQCQKQYTSYPFFYPEDGGSIFIRAASSDPPDYMASHPLFFSENGFSRLIRNVGNDLPGNGIIVLEDIVFSLDFSKEMPNLCVYFSSCLTAVEFPIPR
jgi:hypothetical protein